MKNFVTVFGPFRSKADATQYNPSNGMIGSLRTTGIQPLQNPEQATLPVVRKMTMPGGERINVIRDDVFNKAIKRHKPSAA